MKEYFSNNCSSLVVYKKDNNVFKIFRRNNVGFGRFKNEVFFLNTFSKYNNFPDLIDYNIKTLTLKMNYCGENINKKYIPDNWKEQVYNINDILCKYRVELIDLQPKNILCKNNIIYLIDFDSYYILKKYNNNNLNRLLLIFKNLL